MASAPWRIVGSQLRMLGRVFDGAGAMIQGRLAYTEHLNLSVRNVKHGSKSPAIPPSTFVAPNAAVIGDVKIGENSSVWYGVTIRGDVNTIKIGEYTSIGDHAVIHAAKIANDFPTHIGDNVVIGPRAVIHACSLEDDCMIGCGAKILDGAKVEKRAIVAPGSVVPPGKVVKSGELWSGVPAKKVRDLDTEEIELIALTVDEHYELAREHALELSKSFEQLEKEKKERKFGPDDEGEDMREYRPGEIFNSQQAIDRKRLEGE